MKKLRQEALGAYRKLAVTLITAAVVCGCVESNAKSRRLKTASEGDRTTNGEIAVPPSIEVAGCASEPNPGRVGLRRLTGVEYDNTVRDLIGVQTPLSPGFASHDEINQESGFDNNDQTLTVDVQVVNDWLDASAELAQAALASPQIMTCTPESLSDYDSCARSILAPFTRRAWRRSVTSEELDELLALVDQAVSEGDSFNEAMGLSIQKILVSPYFMYRVERIPEPNSNQPQAIADFAIASRLSYFLWRSMPDDVLLDAAEAGDLRDRAKLRAQVERMLPNAKTQAMIDDLTHQWLLGRETEVAQPDAQLYSEFDEPLRTAFLQETTLFLREVIQENLDFNNLMRSDFTFLNARLAEHYDIDGVLGEQFRRVQLQDDSHRGGLLTQGTVLLGTRTNSVRTSIEQRGTWVLRRLLCEHLPEPPDNVSEQQEQLLEPLGGNPTRREIAEIRSAEPSCGGCHQTIDPIGLGLENFDLVGKWREGIDGAPIDATGNLPGVGSFDGGVELSDALRDDPRFGQCLAKTFLTFALGRNLAGDADRCLVADVVQQASAAQSGAADLITATVLSPAFSFQTGDQ